MCAGCMPASQRAQWVGVLFGSPYIVLAACARSLLAEAKSSDDGFVCSHPYIEFEVCD